ncbi:hypothetical protein DFH09DRAFT_1332833 [Mycena vulgaris]|nr:hypothetical protein DFH09DRAFT_1332833 [Mycena vulgaris]
MLSWLHRIDHFSNIDALTLIRIPPKDLPLVHRTLQSLAASLQHLQLGLGWNRNGLTGQNINALERAFDLSALRRLKTLRFQDVMLTFAFSNPTDPSYERSVIPIVLNITSPALETVAFNIHAHLGGERYSWIDWGSLDAFLAQFPRIRRVEFEIHFEYTEASAYLHETLPLLRAAGVL